MDKLCSLSRNIAVRSNYLPLERKKADKFVGFFISALNQYHVVYG